MKKSLIAGLVAASSMFFLSTPSHAGISLSGTRVVYPGQSKETSVVVKNQSKDDVMIQSWIESLDEKQGDLPFALTPSLSRLGGDKQQILRIFYAGEGLAADRESAFWLSVQEIPQRAKGDNSLQIAVRQRIKLFYRPADLPGKADEAPAQLKWRWNSDGGKPALDVVNDTPYFVSLGHASLKVGTNAYPIVTEMVAPKSVKRLPIKDYTGHAQPVNAKVEFSSINDFGATVDAQADMSK
ncbi:fimbria/pilus periplasmic chaperone [Burkholderia cenocepacia]|uniref:fimbrial biogenesis chaperone n=1 Tax=Burkholderia TaxID=32008 RepID=UPI00158AC389|nr:MULTISPECIES: fimbria/pilus periplasmic chaperone [Burkholderia]MBR8207447.1 fimbria/pilus periplasmic chaperone [Burkholderia cenocepacia]